jgi:CRISPR-associated protein Cmr6
MQQWIKSVTQGKCGNEPMLEQQALRLLRLIQARQGQFAVCQTTWHFATGLGLPHPVEMGWLGTQLWAYLI